MRFINRTCKRILTFGRLLQNLEDLISTLTNKHLTTMGGDLKVTPHKGCQDTQNNDNYQNNSKHNNTWQSNIQHKTIYTK